VVRSAPLPKLTAAAPLSQPREDEGTLLVDGSEVLASVEAAHPEVQPIVTSEPQTDPERAAASGSKAEDDAPVSPVDETIVRIRPGAPTPLPVAHAMPAQPPPLPVRPPPDAPAPEVVPAPIAHANTEPATPAAVEELAGVPVLGTVGTLPPDAALTPLEASPEPLPEAPQAAQPPSPPATESRDFPAVSPALAGPPRSPTAEMEALERTAALASAGARRRVWPWLLVLGLLAVGVLAAVGGPRLLDREPATGRVVLDVSPPEARGRVRLTIAGTDLGVPTHWPVVQSAPSGKVEILASADGFKPALVEAVVGRGNAPTSVLVALQRAATAARFTVLPEPDDAEVRLDGQVVKRSGSHGSFVGELMPGQEHSLQVRRAGYRAVETKVSARSAEEPVELRTTLEPLEFALLVSSSPSGAVVFSGERLLGSTPLATRVPATASALTFRKRCFETAQVPLHLPEQPGARVPVRATLRKVPGCR
jgi:hypothetical protein